MSSVTCLMVTITRVRLLFDVTPRLLRPMSITRSMLQECCAIEDWLTTCRDSVSIPACNQQPQQLLPLTKVCSLQEHIRAAGCRSTWRTLRTWKMAPSCRSTGRAAVKQG